MEKPAFKLNFLGYHIQNDAQFIVSVASNNYSNEGIKSTLKKVIESAERILNLAHGISRSIPQDTGGQGISTATQINELSIISANLQMISQNAKKTMEIKSNYCLSLCEKIDRAINQLEEQITDLPNNRIIHQNAKHISDVLNPMPQVQVDLILQYV